MDEDMEDMDEKELIKYLNIMPQPRNHNFSWFANILKRGQKIAPQRETRM